MMTGRGLAGAEIQIRQAYGDEEIRRSNEGEEKGKGGRGGKWKEIMMLMIL